MMHLKNFCLFILIGVGRAAMCQAPGIEWDNTIGGNGYEYMAGIKATPDGGYVMCGISESKITGDKTENCKGPQDFWVVKLNSLGAIQWQNTIQGNNAEDYGHVILTSDGGYVIAGHSNSGMDYDKTENCWALDYDMWLLKLDSLGGIQWQNTIGGLSQEYMHAPPLQTPDGGYIVCLSSYSDIGGDKNEHNRDAPGGSVSTDYWVIKLSSTGNIQWQKTIGSSGSDYAYKIIATSDGGYIIGGESIGPASWEKSENGYGQTDYWIVKVSAVGAVEWDKTIGGDQGDYLRDIIQIADGNFVVVGTSNSTLSGLKTEGTVGGENFSDIWLLKLNTSGNILWQRTIGGNYTDAGDKIMQTSDGGFVIGASSQSNATGDKTAPNWDVTSPFTMDYWIIKTDEAGNIEWQQTIGGSNDDIIEDLDLTPDGGFIIGGDSKSPISGNKSEPVIGLAGENDYWIVKIAGGPCIPDTETCNGIDDNCNGIIDDGVVELCSISAGGPISFCPGGSVNLTATYSGTGIQWYKNGFVISGATSSSYVASSKGTYTAMTSSACGTALSNEIFVSVYKNPSAFISPDGPTLFCSGDSVHLNVTPVGGCTYQWYKGASLLAGETGLSYTATTSGNYKCRVTKIATGCFKNSNVIAVSVPCREGEFLTENNPIEIYPNPSKGTFAIQANVMTQDFDSPELTIEIYNNLGQLIFSKEVTATDGIVNELIELNNITPGIYLVRLGSKNIYKAKNIIME